ncbi:hypothetical protein [Sphingobacterium humi]|uniref:TerB family tellurite resistance protein n=1 Tax=Sphingobacterium humi TaxID=1796905 RepID=A0A6N8L6N3_9SPHI|nr:hypothetical protein [Sphingobacterium humi]MVZ63848.1 hypothetical protein [Sphingobacterium humi]
MKIKLLLFGLLVCLGQLSKGQTTAEWLRQKSTQERYLIQQILANGFYKDYLKNGYSIIQAGLKSIGSWKEEEHNFHRIFFDNQRYGMMRVMEENQKKKFYRLGRQFTILLQKSAILARDGILLNQERFYVQQVLYRFATASKIYYDKLNISYSDPQISMNDRQRMDFINRLLSEVEDDLIALKKFTQQLNILITSRKEERIETIHLRRLLTEESYEE